MHGSPTDDPAVGTGQARRSEEPATDTATDTATDMAADMVFAQVARLELDEVLEQLVRRAREVQDTQGRLRGLLRAFLDVGRAESLDAILRQVVEAAGSPMPATPPSVSSNTAGSSSSSTPAWTPTWSRASVGCRRARGCSGCSSNTRRRYG
jgi:hypothetical protein